jgi:dTMP kinase
MRMKLRKGILVVFEGIDGSGKSTQAHLLMEWLKKKGFDVVYFREPSTSRWGRMVKKKALVADSLSPEEELDLFIKDRRANVRKNLIPALNKKKFVILDRYYYSTIAYQGAKGIDMEMIKRMNEEFVVQPDMVFVLDIDSEKGLARIENRRKKDKLFEKEDYLMKVREIFQGFKGEKFIHLDGLKAKGEISEKIKEAVLNYLKKAGRSKI